MNVWRTVREFSAIGVAGLHIEDQSLPKRCGHLDGKGLISKEEMIEKIGPARDAAGQAGPIIIARTDAIAVEGLDSVLERAEAYIAAGAEMIFVEAPRTLDQIQSIGRHLRAPKMISMFESGKTSLIPVQQLAAWDHKLVIILSDLQRAVILAMESTLATIKRDGNSAASRALLAPLADLNVPAPNGRAWREPASKCVQNRCSLFLI